MPHALGIEAEDDPGADGAAERGVDLVDVPAPGVRDSKVAVAAKAARTVVGSSIDAFRKCCRRGMQVDYRKSTGTTSCIMR